MIKKIIKSLPFVRYLREKKYDQKFERNRHDNLFRGVFNSYSEASANLPQSQQIGYDNKDSATM